MNSLIHQNTQAWEHVKETDPKYTKAGTGTGGGGGTSINAIYMVQKATELWGPIGDLWGYSIIEERYDNGVPVYQEGHDVVFEQTHTILLELFYPRRHVDNGEGRATVRHYGHTPYLYYSPNKNRFYCDGEASKKSVTDALKKCLSLLGFCADIYMGEFDDMDYLKRAKLKSEIKHSEDQEQTKDKIKQELIDYREQQIKAYTLIPNRPALASAHQGVVRKITNEMKVIGTDPEKFLAPVIEAYNARKEQIESPNKGKTND